MSLLVVVLLFAVGFGVFIALFTLSLQWVSKRAAQQLQGRFDDVDEIVEHGCIPEAWLQPFRERLEEARREGKSERSIQRIGKRAQRQCMKRINILIRFMENEQFYDQMSTRQKVLERLNTQRNLWASSDWQKLFEVNEGGK